MPAWAETDILAGQGNSSSGRSTSTVMNVSGGTNQTMSVDPTTQARDLNLPVATGNPGNDPSQPVPGERWQGGAPNPNGTQAPNGQQTGGRYVDPTYQRDATGRVLTPEEQAYWREYDRRRAEAGSIARSNNIARPEDKNKGLATNAVYDPITQTYSMVDSDGKWTYGLKVADLQAKLSEDLKKQYPDWWWGQYASQQNQQRRYELDAGAFDSQKFASMGQQGTRYGPTNF